MNLSKDFKNSIKILLETKNVIKSSSEISDYLDISKQIRNTLNDNDKIIFDLMINHAMKCENKVPLGFEFFLKRIFLSFENHYNFV